MLKTKAIRKIFTTTLTMFIILTIFTISTPSKEKNTLRTNLEIEDVTNLSTNNAYLLNSSGLLVRTEIFIDSNNQEEQIKKIIQYLTKNNNKTPNGLNSYIPKNTKLLNLTIQDKNVSLDFSEEFLKYDKSSEKQIITGIVYSILELDNIESVTILVEGKDLNNYKQPITKSIGINNEFLINNRNDLNKVVVYYLNNIEDNNYYVPVTKYLNDKREKIEIIVDELNSDNLSSDLISYLNSNTKLLDYKEEADVLFLNFNDYLLDNNEEITNNILKTIAYSVFDNYDVNMVMFEVNNKNIGKISVKDLK